MKIKWTPEEQKKHRELWCEWLESGNYVQARQMLRDYVYTDESDELGYCCLGIGCLVYKEVTGEGEWVDIADYSAFRAGALEDDHQAEKQGQYDQSESELPLAVRDFFGLNSEIGQYHGEIIDNLTPCLTRLNDHQEYDFEAIAKVIREEPPGLIRTQKKGGKKR